MKGLCHTCFKSNVDITVSEKTGWAICKSCNIPDPKPVIEEWRIN